MAPRSVTLLSDSHDENALSPSVVRLAGNATETRPLDWKAAAPISVMPDGSESESSWLQFRNAFAPMRRRLDGSETDES